MASGGVQVDAEAPRPERGDIRFPALSFSRDGLLYALDSLDRISQATKRGVETGFYRNLTLIDSDATRFRVVDAQRVRTLPPRGFGDILGLLSGNPRWQVQLIFAADSQRVSMQEVKRLILDAFRKQSEDWDAMMDFEEFRQRIEDAASVDRVFASFREFHLM
jgi:hypothetical protein